MKEGTFGSDLWSLVRILLIDAIFLVLAIIASWLVDVILDWTYPLKKVRPAVFVWLPWVSQWSLMIYATIQTVYDSLHGIRGLLRKWNIAEPPRVSPVSPEPSVEGRDFP